MLCKTIDRRNEVIYCVVAVEMVIMRHITVILLMQVAEEEVGRTEVNYLLHSDVLHHCVICF